MLLATALAASDAEYRQDDPVAVVRHVLNAPDDELDYLEAKLAFDSVVDPGLDRAAATAQVESLVAAARALAKNDIRSAVRLGAVRTAIYESGPWNGHRPFAYDMSDP